MLKEVYRACASIVVFRPAEEGIAHEILILHKPRKRDSWQLPQGGVEAGESVPEAALRELKEEAGMEVSMIGQSGIVYQYEYPASYRRFRPDNVRGQRIAFIFANVGREVPVNVDGKEIDGFVWARPEDIPRYIRRKQYLQIIRNLLAEAADLLR
ncbi:MAG: NUDIX domain-containing protein [Candidatus Peribacteraceae bacterium]|nr:NUDIX domain-containing protein [Candidatus Peribacteraceae bacterium]